MAPPFIACSSVIQHRTTFGKDTVHELLDITQRHWNQQAAHPRGYGLEPPGCRWPLKKNGEPDYL